MRDIVLFMSSDF